jgi:hypothetical protein
MLEMQQNELPKVPPIPWLTEATVVLTGKKRQSFTIAAPQQPSMAQYGPRANRRFGNIRQSEGFSRIQSKESNYEKPGYFSRYRGRRYSFNGG